MDKVQRQQCVEALSWQINFGKAVAFRAPGSDAVGKQWLRGAVLTRTSKGKPEQTTGIARQRDVFEFAESIKLRLHYIFDDPDVPGWMRNRPALLLVQLYVRFGLIDALLFEDPDRLGRPKGIIFSATDFLESYNVPVISVMEGKALNDVDLTIRALMAANEVKKLGTRTAAGIEKTPENTSGQKITKRVGYGHVKKYEGFKKYHVEIDEKQAEIVKEIHRSFDEDESLLTIVRWLNERGVPPPGRAKKWKYTHLLTGTRALRQGILVNKEAIGIFENHRTMQIKDGGSGDKRRQPRPENEWHPVHRPDLAIFKTDEERALFERNQKRVAALTERYASGTPRRYAGVKGRGLLSSCIECGECRTRMYYDFSSKETPQLRCTGAKFGNCDNWIEVDALRLDRHVLDIIRDEVVDQRVLQTWHRMKVEAMNSAVAETEGSREKLETRLEGLGRELALTLEKLRGNFDESRATYEEEERLIRKEMAEISAKLSATRSVDSLSQLWDERVATVTDIFCRLDELRSEQPDGWKDESIVLTIRNCIEEALLVPNIHNFGATLLLKLSFDHFFSGSESEKTELPRWSIAISPRHDRCRVPSYAARKEVLSAPERYRLRPDEWKTVEAFLNSLPRNFSKPNVASYWTRRSSWELLFLRIRASILPESRKIPGARSDDWRAAALAGELRHMCGWKDLFALLKRAGAEWVDQIHPGLLAWLSEPKAELNGAWKAVKLQPPRPRDNARQSPTKLLRFAPDGGRLALDADRRQQAG